MSEKFENIAEKWLTPVLRGRSEWMCSCPFCPGNSSLQFNIVSGLWICFRCGEKGSAKRLVGKLGGSYQNPATDMDRLQRGIYQARIDLKEDKSESQKKAYPESYLLRFGKKPHKIWKDRGYDNATIREWELGYDPIGPAEPGTDGKERVGPCGTIPVRNPGGDLEGVIFRRVANEFPRYIYPLGFDRVGGLFGSWRIQGGKLDSVGIVEGSTDTIRLSQSGCLSVAQYGSKINVKQTQLIRRLGIKEVVLFYDFDPAGWKATQAARDALSGMIIRSVKWDTEKYCLYEKKCACSSNHHPMELGTCSRKKLCRCGRVHQPDPGSLDLDEAREMFDNAPRVGRKKLWTPPESRRTSGTRKRPSESK